MKKRYLLSALVEDSAYLRDLISILEKLEAQIEKTEDLGVKKLTYKIKKHTELSLISVFMLLEPEQLAKINSILKHDEHIVRYLLSMWSIDPNKEKKKERVVEGEKVNV